MEAWRLMRSMMGMGARVAGACSGIYLLPRDCHSRWAYFGVSLHSRSVIAVMKKVHPHNVYIQQFLIRQNLMGRSPSFPFWRGSIDFFVAFVVNFKLLELWPIHVAQFDTDTPSS